MKSYIAEDLDIVDVTFDLRSEQDDLLWRWLQGLRGPTGDGKNKRKRGEKPPWYNDDSHIKSALRHIERWEKGELVDADSGCHPLWHAAWRLCAIACIDTDNVPTKGTDA